MRAVVLVGHGSHRNARSAESTFRWVDSLRAWLAGTFAPGGRWSGSGPPPEVIAAFWKEEPSLAKILRTLPATDVLVLPLFLSEGYFTETVLPRELGLAHRGQVPLEGATEVVTGRQVRYLPPYVVHPSIYRVVIARAREVLRGDPASATVVVVGHGTDRHEGSARATIAAAERVRAEDIFGHVLPAFLDQEPRLSRVWELAEEGAEVIVVPLFGAEGWHTQETIPEELGLRGRALPIRYADPVGTHSDVGDVLLEMVSAWLQVPVAPGSEEAVADARLIEAAYTACDRRARSRGGLRVGELWVHRSGSDFELRHALDEGRKDLTEISDVESLRRAGRRDGTESFRPVPTFVGLPRGFRFTAPRAELRGSLGAIYPAVVEECALHAAGRLPIVRWPEVAARQTGVYANVSQATPEALSAVIRRVCGRCLRTRLWDGHTLESTVLDGVPGAIPCAEPCSYFVNDVRETLTPPGGASASGRPRSVGPTE